MQLRQSTLFVTFVLRAVLTSEADIRASEIDDRLQTWLEQRRTIASYDATLTFARQTPSKIEFLIRALLNNSTFRLDQTWQTFETNPDQVGRKQNAAVVGSEARTNSNRTGAMLDFSEASTYLHLDLRRLGTLTSPFMNLKPTKDRKEWGGIVSQYLALEQIEVRTTETVHGIELVCYRKERPGGSTIGVYFDSSESYRGCDVRRGEHVSRTIFTELKHYGGLTFPSDVMIESWKGTDQGQVERITFANIDFGRSLTDTDFNFSALGVKEGDKVDIGAEFTNADGVVPGSRMVWNGEKLIPGDSFAPPTQSFQYSRYAAILGGIVLSVLAFRIFRDRRGSS